MNRQGFDYTEIDIAGKTEDELREILKDKEVILVDGGNTFYLLKCVRESGFTKVVKELIERGVIYVGSSAGSYIACPTIEMAEKTSRHDLDKCGIVDYRSGVADYTAMNLVPFLIVANYTPDRREELKEKLADVTLSIQDGASLPIKILTDEQAILVIDDEVKLLGGGEEVVF